MKQKYRIVTGKGNIIELGDTNEAHAIYCYQKYFVEHNQEEKDTSRLEVFTEHNHRYVGAPATWTAIL